MCECLVYLWISHAPPICVCACLCLDELSPRYSHLKGLDVGNVSWACAYRMQDGKADRLWLVRVLRCWNLASAS